jgi:hypothetical protein
LQASNLDRFVDVTNAAVYKSGAAQLIRETIGIAPKDQTFVIHVARWSEGGEIVKQNWFVYQTGAWTDAQFATSKRIYGKRQIWFLYIQINAQSNSNTTYVIETQKKAPAAYLHLQSATSLFGVTLPTLTAGEPRNIWNAELVSIPYMPSYVAITPKFTGGAPATFDNEGLSRIDFSAAVPVNKTSNLGMFGLADVYLRPVDVAGLGFGNWPHLIGGVRVGNQPLKNILVGIGWGPMYGGVVIGSGHYAFSFGVNISASAALKK